MTFRPDVNEVYVETYSPTLGTYLYTGESEFTLTVCLDDYITLNPALRFQNGVAGYNATQDTWIGEYAPDAGHGNSQVMIVDDDTENSWFDDYQSQGLIRFDDITQGPVYEGDPAPTAIPQGATILSANLTINLANDCDLGHPEFYIYRMTRDWNEGSTWNSLGSGIAVGDDTAPGLVAMFYGDNDPDLDFHRTLDVSSAVNPWVAGEANYGLAILPQRLDWNDDGIEIRSSEDTSLRDITHRPALDIEFTYEVVNVPPTVTQMLVASQPSTYEGEEVELSMAAQDPNPLDPLTFTINGEDVGYATGAGSISYLVLFEDDGDYPFEGQVADDEVSVDAGQVVVPVLNLPPEITELSDDLTVAVGESFTFSAAASDAGVLDVLTYRWDLDGDAQFDDFEGEGGESSFAAAGTHMIGVEVDDGDGGFAYGAIEIEVVACFGDLDGDGYVDLGDLAQVLGRYGMPAGATYADGDLDNDGDVDLADLAALLGVYGTVCP